MTDKFKKGDIVTFYESLHPWSVEGYVRLLSGERRVSIRRIELPSIPHKKAILGYAEEADLVLS